MCTVCACRSGQWDSPAHGSRSAKPEITEFEMAGEFETRGLAPRVTRPGALNLAPFTSRATCNVDATWTEWPHLRRRVLDLRLTPKAETHCRPPIQQAAESIPQRRLWAPVEYTTSRSPCRLHGQANLYPSTRKPELHSVAQGARISLMISAGRQAICRWRPSAGPHQAAAPHSSRIPIRPVLPRPLHQDHREQALFERPPTPVASSPAGPLTTTSVRLPVYPTPPP